MLIAGRNAFLTDFGLTKRVAGDNPITHVGDVVGTIHYVAPEQIEGGEVTSRTDVYSLGCVLYHCLTGELPFARDTDVAVDLRAPVRGAAEALALRATCPKASTTSSRRRSTSRRTGASGRAAT